MESDFMDPLPHHNQQQQQQQSSEQQLYDHNNTSQHSSLDQHASTGHCLFVCRQLCMFV